MRHTRTTTFLLMLWVAACSSEDDAPGSQGAANTAAGGGAGVMGLGGASGALQASGGMPGVAPGSGGTSTAAGGMTAGGGMANAGGALAGAGGTAPAAGGQGGLGDGGAAGAGGSVDGSGGDPGMGDRVLPPVSTTDGDGPFSTTIDQGGDYWVFRPEPLGVEVPRHPVFVWGTGATAVPSQYTDHFGRMASHGFVIVAPTPAMLSASHMSAALDWILQENTRSGSPYEGKLDPDRVAMGGHSQGSIATFEVEQNETRLKTTLHVAGGSFDGRGSSKVKTPTAYICGETDFALPNCEQDFENVEDQPTFFSTLSGVDHVQAARQALPGMIAWLRWHLAGETERSADFTGPSGEFFSGIWVSETKNWNY